MSGFDAATPPGIYWAVLFSSVALAIVCAMLARTLSRTRRAFRLEQQQFFGDLGALQARIEAQQRELERMNVQLAEQTQRLAREEGALADAERTIQAKEVELA